MVRLRRIQGVRSLECSQFLVFGAYRGARPLCVAHRPLFQKGDPWGIGSEDEAEVGRVRATHSPGGILYQKGES